MKTSYHLKLKRLIDQFIQAIYQISKSFPKEEKFAITSQLRRAALSIMLNFLEGYARNNKKVFKQFLNISYGSFKETKYLIYLCYKLHYLDKKSYSNLNKQAEEIGAMLWGILIKLK